MKNSPILRIWIITAVILSVLGIAILITEKSGPTKKNEPLQIAVQSRKSPNPNNTSASIGKKSPSLFNTTTGAKVVTSNPGNSSQPLIQMKALDPRHPVDPFENAKVLAKKESSPDKRGRFEKIEILETNGKYPLIRVAEKIDRDPRTGNEYVVSREEMVADHMIVKLASGADKNQLDSINKKFGYTIRQTSLAPNTFLVAFNGRNPDALPQAIQEISHEKNTVSFAEPDFVSHSTVTPNDPDFSKDYGLDNTGQTGGVSDADIDALEAWDINKGSQNVLVGIIDTGVDYTHPDLAANIWTNPGEIPNNGIDDDGDGFIDDVHGWNFVSNNNNPMDDNLHGTHVAGTIGAVGNNNIGVAGVCWNVSIVPIKFLDATGSGYNSDAVNAIYYATRVGARLTSNSWGGGSFSQAMKDAIDNAAVHGILFIAAAGNSASNNDSTAFYPANYNSSNIISVAATDASDHLASFSNYGATTVDVAAPGVRIYSTFPTYMTSEMQKDGFSTLYGTISGTSMATPHVSGLAALLWSDNASLTYDQVKSRIINRGNSNTSLTGKVVSNGRINAYNSLNPYYGAGPGILNLASLGTDDPEGNKDHIVSPGEIIQINPNFLNSGQSPLVNETITLVSSNADCSVLSPISATFSSIIPNASVTPSFRVQISSNAVNNETINIVFQTQDQSGTTKYINSSFTVFKVQPKSEVSINFAPGEMLGDPVRNVVYLLDQTNLRVIAIDTSSGQTIAMAALAGTPKIKPPVTNGSLTSGLLAASVDGKKLYVALTASKKIQVFALPGLTSVTTFSLAFEPVSIVASANGNLYVSSTEDGGSIRQLNSANGALISSFGVYYMHSVLRSNALHTRLFIGEVGLSGSGSIDEFDISGTAAVFIKGHPFDMQNGADFAVDETNRRIYTASGGVYGVQVTDMDTDESQVWPFETSPYGTAVCVTPNLPIVYGASGYNIYQFDRSTGTQLVDNEVTTGNQDLPERCMVMTPNGNVVYIKEEWTGNSTTGIDGTLYWLGILGANSLNIAPPNKPPQVSLTEPLNGAVYTAPLSINLSATASDSDGKVTKVRFYHGSTLIGTDTTAPYSCTWTNVALGSYTITAKAYDNYGAISTSSAASIKVVPQPLSGKIVRIDLGSASLQTPGWNNLTSGKSGDGLINLVDSTGQATTMGLTVVDSFWQFTAGASNENGTSNSVLFPASATHDSFFIGTLSGKTDNTAQVRLTGLSAQSTYSVRLYASRLINDTSDRTTIYTINGVSKELQVKNNVNNYVEFTNIVAPNNSFDIQMNIKSGSTYGYLGVIEISEN